jgi:hypothetical protein
MAVGIDAAYTAGHGGLKLSPKRAKEVDPAWREPAGWYEEDCAWSKAVITHHQDLPADHVAAAHKTAREWYPDEYEAIVGKDPAKYGLTDYQPITTEDSHIVRDREFLPARAGPTTRCTPSSMTWTRTRAWSRSCSLTSAPTAAKTTTPRL